eukprot:TRINITY_DN2350_c0_g1_i6.p1 TRINITY_DN2350_c0_g1~~TRINITY_DN2350_c0_g1_i6.p1  ORF type:complete len:873 (-),score=181.67 TRINITY_DN2350_c0_g1_i6:635-3253(-)
MGIDCSVGTIVWVRRRNGSWWPGRILGSDELSASHLMSPRSGTPVKLLGREDASVDWYNLEKSKRVKAFRCGEFDDCIRRAESSQGIPPKKREKYARREDAIIHALELENQQYEKKRKKLGIGSNYWSNKMLGTSNRDLGSCSLAEDFSGNDKGRDHCRYINRKPQTLSKKPVSSLEEESMGNLLYVQKGKHPKPSWEGDNSEATPRMRGLQDFGLRTATSRQKLSASIASWGFRKPFLANEPCVLPTVGRNIGTLNYVGCNKNFMSIKNKRSLGGVAEESLIRRRDRRRPLVQVLQNSAKSPVCQSVQSNGDTMSITMQGEKEQVGLPCQAKRGKGVYQPIESNDFLDHKRIPLEQMQTSPPHFGMDNSLVHPGSLTEEDTSSGLIKAQESDSSAGDYLDHDIEEDEALFSDPANSGRYISRGDSVYQVPMQPGNMDTEELDESELSSYVSQLQPHEQTAGIASDMGGSKWQLKGKRNIRNLTKRPVELIDGKDPVEIPDKCNVSIHQALCRYEGNIIKTTRINSGRALGQQGLHYRGEEFSYTYEEGGLIENDLVQTQMVGFVRRYPSMLKASSGDRGRSNNSFISSDEDSHVISPSIWEADRQSRETLRGYWEESDGCFDPVYVGHLGDQMEPMLLDVDLKVQASYQGERVPLVSLMSKLNGKAIVGHPVQIETLGDGSSDLLLCRDDFCEDLPGTDGNAPLPPVWRTARRTAMQRVPRPPPSSALEGEEASTFQYSDLERKCPFDKPYVSHVKNKVKMKGALSHIRRPLAQKKFPKKLLKKVSLSGQKTRTLSSIAIQQKPSRKSRDSRLDDKNVELYGLIKPEGTKPVVACVPVKLAFSRIREAIGRPPSTPSNHGVLIAGHAERKP